MFAEINDRFCYHGRTYDYHLYVPDYYTPLHGMKGLILLQDKARTTGDVLPWLAKMRAEEVMLLRIDPPEEGWSAGDAEGAAALIADQLTWAKGSYAVLSAYRYIAGEGTGGIAAAKMIETNPNGFAASALWDSPVLPEKDDLNIPIAKIGTGEAFDFDALWNSVCGWRRVPVTPDYGTVLPVRDMSHVKCYTERIGGLLRTFYVAAPSVLPEGPLPVVFNLHGITSNGLKFMEQNELDLVAEKYGFLAVAVTGYLHRWNASASPDFPDDAACMDEILDLLSKEYSIDRTRVFSMGFSMGSAMSERLTVDRPFTYAAVASFSGHIIEPGDTLTMFRQSDTRGSEIYESVRSDIPRQLVQIYGECEPKTAYPGNQDHATVFWKKVYGCGADAPAEEFEIDGRLIAKKYRGRFGSYISILEKGLTHTYYTDLCEWVYANVFAKCARPENTVRNAAVNDGILQFELKGKAPEQIVVTLAEGSETPLCLEGTERSAVLPAEWKGKKLWIIPVYACGSTNAPAAAQG